MHRLLPFALLLAVPSAASAQPFFRAPIVGQGAALVSANHHDTVADATADGGTIAAVHFDSDVVIGGRTLRSLDAGRTVALVRLDRAGRVLWSRAFAEEAGPGRPHVRAIGRVDSLADGGALVAGTFGAGGDEQGLLMRVDAQGRTAWSVTPSVTSDYSRFVAAPSPNGTAIVLGHFFRGRFQLPGLPEWSSQQRFTSFLAEVDLASGQVRWARRILGEGRSLDVASDGTIFVAGQFQRQLRVGRSLVRGGAERSAFVARYAPDGTPRDAVGYSTPAEDHPRGVALTPGGGFAVLVSSGAAASERFELLGFDAEAQPTFRQPLGPRALLARARGEGPILAAIPGAVRRASIRGRAYDVVDQLELVHVSAQGTAVSRRAIRFPGVGLLARSLHARGAGARVGLSGALASAGGSESFQVWLDAPAPPPAVLATVGAVL